LRTDGSDPNLEERIDDLERLFSDEESDLRGLDAEESLENWNIPRKTGDPLIDRWEQEIAQGLNPNLDEVA
jgi:hypothetical protein